MNTPYTVLTFESGPVATNAYLLIAGSGAMIIDAPPGAAEPVSAAIEEAEAVPSVLALTHTHWDHTADVAVLKRRYPEMRVLVHRDDEHRLTDPMAHSVWPLPFTIEAGTPDGYFGQDDVLVFGGSRFRVLHTPGHTEGGVCLYDESAGVLFAGDTLFAGSVGRTDLPGGSHGTLLRSIRERLLALPDDVRVFPGHGPATTIGEERESNPFL